MFGSGFSTTKLKPQLKMASQRIALKINQKTQQNKMVKKEVAQLLGDSKEEKAKIKVEHVIREDFVIEAYEIVQLLCDMVTERLALIASEKACPLDMKESVNTLIYAADRTEIKELAKIRDMFGKKYGKEFIAAAHSGQHINKRVAHKLSVEPPSHMLVIQYLKEIAKVHKVTWKPDEATAVAEQEMLKHGTGTLAYPQPAPTGYSVGQTGYKNGMPYLGAGAQVAPPAAGGAGAPPGAGGAGDGGGHGGLAAFPSIPAAPTDMPGVLSSAGPVVQPMYPPQAQQQPQMPPSQQPPSNMPPTPNIPQMPPTAPTTQPDIPKAPTGPPERPTAPPADAPSSETKSEIPDFDELTARFNALKKRG